MCVSGNTKATWRAQEQLLPHSAMWVVTTLSSALVLRADRQFFAQKHTRLISSMSADPAPHCILNFFFGSHESLLSAFTDGDGAKNRNRMRRECNVSRLRENMSVLSAMSHFLSLNFNSRMELLSTVKHMQNCCRSADVTSDPPSRHPPPLSLFTPGPREDKASGWLGLHQRECSPQALGMYSCCRLDHMSVESVTSHQGTGLSNVTLSEYDAQVFVRLV